MRVLFLALLIGLSLPLVLSARGKGIDTSPASSGSDRSAVQNDWLLFRGTPEQTGFAQGRLPARLEVLWTFQAEDAFENAVAVSRGLVFAASMDEFLYALDLNSGKVKWKYKAAPFKASPAVKGDAVYVGDVDGKFHCVSVEDGKPKWLFDGNAEIGGANFFGDSVLFTSHDEHLYCLDTSGKLRWKFKTDGPIYGSVAIAEGKTFLVGCDSQMHVLDVQAGKELRSVDLDGQTGATAAVRGDRLYVGTMKNEVRCIDWKKGETVWTYKPGRMAQAFYSSPAVSDKVVVIGGRDNRVHCIDRVTGKSLWQMATEGRVDSSPVIVDNRVIVGSQDSRLYVLDLATGQQVQRVELDGPVTGSPVVVAEKILLGTQKGTLYCLGAKK
jgi:outer membrane protein assembly factor BamB